MKSYKNTPVYYIDGIPCVFRSIREDYALVEVIDIKYFGAKTMYVAKRYGFFAHGDTLKEANEQAEQKWLSSQSIEKRIEEFKKQFKKGIAYKASQFYDWHTLLTGSCKLGKDMWIAQMGVDLASDMTVEQFITITKGAYGGEIIKRLS